MDASTVYFQEEMDLDIRDEEARVRVSLTEAGNIDLEVVDSPQFGLSPDLSENIRTLEGRTTAGESVELSNVMLSLGLRSNSSEGSYRFISSVSTPTEIEIDGTEGYVSQVGEDVSVKFDVLGFKHFVPRQAVDTIKLVERDNWSVVASPVSDLDERIEYIKSHKILLRTAEVVVRLDIPGDISHQVDEALDKLEDLLSLSGFVQGLGPSFVRGELVEIGGDSSNPTNEAIRYTILWATKGAIGSAFKAERLIWGNEFPTYLERAFDNYDSHVRDDLRLRQVLGYYWDALNSTRPVEGRYLSVCSAIELLAKRYSDLYNQQSRTQDRIEYLVDELGVEIDDLADFAATSDRAASRKYFYSYSRQYVVHGDNNPTWSELLSDFEAALTLLQRLMRNQLVGSLEADQELETLADLNPQGVVEFD